VHALRIDQSLGLPPRRGNWQKLQLADSSSTYTIQYDSEWRITFWPESASKSWLRSIMTFQSCWLINCKVVDQFLMRPIQADYIHDSYPLPSTALDG